MGDHLVPSQDTKKMLFIANGIGITPFIGLVKESLVSRTGLESVKLLNGQRYEQDFIYHDYFNTLQKQHSIFTYHAVASREKKEGFHSGYVTDVLRDMDLSDYKVYMCGSSAMIRECYEILLEKGISKQDIFYESEERIKLSA